MVEQEKQKINIFISYSHKDKVYFNIFAERLKDAVKNPEQFIWNFWCDKEINIGSDWEKDILENIEKSDVAILLVSNGFFASGFIKDKEFNRFLEQESQDQTLILPVLLGPCNINSWTELTKKQFFMPDGDKYNQATKQDFTFSDLVNFRGTDGKQIPNPNINRYINDFAEKAEQSFKKMITSKENNELILSRDDFKLQIEHELQHLSPKQRVIFAWHCAVLALPVLGNEGNFDFWKPEDRQKHLGSVLRALDIASSSLASSTAVAYASAAGTAAASYIAAAYVAYASASAASFGCTPDTSSDTFSDACSAIQELGKTIKIKKVIQLVIKDILKSIKNNTELEQINFLELYDVVWVNFQKALVNEGCSYWADLYQSLFENNFQIDEAELEKRMNVPPEIREQGASAVGKYLYELAKGAETLNETRIIMLGDKGSGKTSISRRLCNPLAKMPELSESTPGVDTLLWETEDKINVHIWDFAGHIITHSVHKFFLSERCLYIMVLDGRLENRNIIEYWLNFMISYGGDSKAIILINKKDEHHVEIQEYTLREKYNIAGVFNFSVKDDSKELEIFRKYVSDYIKDNPTWNRQLIPKQYYQVKEELEKLFFKCETGTQKETIERKEFVKLARKYKEKSPEELLSHLNCLGIVLWYPTLKKYHTLVLNPEWISQGIYKIINWLNNKRICYINLENFSEVFKEDIIRYPEDKHEFLYDLMKHYELAFEYFDQENHCLIVPHLLKKDRPKELLAFPIEESLMLRYKSEMDLPPDTISRFIVRHNLEIIDINNTVWRYGVVLKDGEGSFALVREDDRIISVTVKGTNKQEFIAELRDTLEEIFKSYKVKKPDLQYKIEEFGRLPEQESVWLSESKVLNHILQGIPYFIDILGKYKNLEDVAEAYKIKKEDLGFSQKSTLENLDVLSIEDGTYIVVKAVIDNYSNRMEISRGETIKIKLRKLLAKHCMEFKHFEVIGDYSFSIINTEVNETVKALVRLAEDLHDEHPAHPLLRIAVDFGKITTNDKSLLRSAVRIEPKVKPGEVWITEKVKPLLNQRNQNVLIEVGDVQINKPDEPFERVHMYRFPG